MIIYLLFIKFSDVTVKLNAIVRMQQ